jgi:hypothetical protein
MQNDSQLRAAMIALANSLEQEGYDVSSFDAPAGLDNNESATWAGARSSALVAAAEAIMDIVNKV